MAFDSNDSSRESGSREEAASFQIRCLVYTRPFLRSDSLEMSMYIGRSVLADMYDHMRVNPEITSLALSFPETWLNIVEQRQLYSRCARYLPNLRSLTLTTHSVYIMQCTEASCIRIMDNDIRPDQHDITIVQYGPAETGLINATVLTVLGSNQRG